MARQTASMESPKAEGRLLVEGSRKSHTVSFTGTAPEVPSEKARASVAA
jgi:hypothetical protein